MSGLLLAMLDQSIVGTALPKIVETLGGSDLYVWVATAYLVTATVSLPDLRPALGPPRPARAAADRHGPVPGRLGARRDLAEHGAADRLPRRCRASARARSKASSFILVADLFGGRRNAALQGALAGLMGVAFIAGPLVGGFLADHVGWRSVFTVNLPIGLAALAVVARRAARVGRASSERKGTPLDLAGIALLTLGVGLLLVGLSERDGRADRRRPAPWSRSFIAVERRAVAPIIPLKLFKDRRVGGDPDRGRDVDVRACSPPRCCSRATSRRSATSARPTPGC